MQNRVYSEQFDDIYFSPEDGLAESEFVFLRGNDLPARWAGRDVFTIAETGFGTGLNFLLTVKRFMEDVREQGREDAQLHFISVEKFPLSRAQVADALSCWDDELSPFYDELVAQYPLRVPGFHRIQIGRNIFLTLIFGDANEEFAKLTVPHGVDAWFLDGFAPAKNPDMWSDDVFAQMARLSAADATFATFTAAGFVKRGLRDVGFNVRKEAGYGRKRERLLGTFAGESSATVPHLVKTKPRVAVVGGGLAGTSCAYVLRDLAEVTIFEAADNLAAGASGNRVGMCNPRFSAQRDDNAVFYTAAYAQAVRTIAALGDAVGYRAGGTVHLVTDEAKDKRFCDVIANWGWHEDHIGLLDVASASEAAGVEIMQEALFLPDGFSVCPEKLCHVYAENADVRLNAPVTDMTRDGDRWHVNGEAFDSVILANGAGAAQFFDLDILGFYNVRGQVSYIPETDATKNMAVNIAYGGYLTPARDGVHVLGSTFKKWIDHDDVTDEDHAENLARLADIMPDVAVEAKVLGGRAAFRTSLPDRFPVIGVVADVAGWRAAKEQDLPNAYISTAHGSHGIISALCGAHLIADMILERAYSLPDHVVKALSVSRILRRAKRKSVL